MNSDDIIRQIIEGTIKATKLGVIESKRRRHTKDS